MATSDAPPLPTVLPLDASFLIDRITANLGAARALTVAVQLGIFTRIAEGARTAEEVAQAAGASARGIARLLDVLVALGFLEKDGSTYTLAPISAAYLVRDRPLYAGLLMEGDWLWESWAHLADSVRTGRPFRHVDDPSEGAPFFKALIPTLHVVNLEGSRRAAGLLVSDAWREHARRVLDIGCGSAVWSIAIAERGGRGTRVVAQDLPAVLAVTREYVRLHRVESQYEFLPGDQREIDFGAGLYDVIVIARYLHELAPAAAADLLRRSFRALRSGGTVSIADWMPNAERTGPLSPLVYALRMLLHTEEGNAHTAEEYEEWLRAAGFTQIRRTPDVGWDVPLILGVKP